MESPPKFYFFSAQMATKFHIAKRLLEIGWQEAANKDEAIFSDENLTLNDEISKHLEYKHLLAQLVMKHAPSFMPLTYCINDSNYQQILAKIVHEHHIVNNVYEKNVKDLKWILKPSMLNNADNILLFNNVEELKVHFSNPKRLGGEHVLQRYLSNPDLIDGRKYTFRISAVITNYGGVYLYKQGYVNISAYPFEDDAFKNKKIHITNYVLDGNFSHIEQRPTQAIEDFPQIYLKMCEMVTTILRSVIKEAPFYLQPKNVKSFEIFGFDFIRDQNKKLWLLEVNQAPDAPTFEENKLDNILWKDFWQDIINEFVIPIAQDVPPKSGFTHYTQLLKAKDCYSPYKNFFYQLKHFL
jgi:tubulin--tyrosine ligase